MHWPVSQDFLLSAAKWNPHETVPSSTPPIHIFPQISQLAKLLPRQKLFFAAKVKWKCQIPDQTLKQFSYKKYQNTHGDNHRNIRTFGVTLISWIFNKTKNGVLGVFAVYIYHFTSDATNTLTNKKKLWPITTPSRHQDTSELGHPPMMSHLQQLFSLKPFSAGLRLTWGRAWSRRCKDQPEEDKRLKRRSWE